VEAKAGGLEQARKAKNLKVFDPRTSQAKVWLTNFKSICALNQLTDRQKVIFFHECLDDDPRALFDSKFQVATVTMSEIVEWFLETYPSPANRMYAQQVIRACNWELKQPAERFIAEFNHCFIHHRDCDEQTKILLLLDKLPPTMRAQAELQVGLLQEYRALTQWVVDHEKLKLADMGTRATPVNLVQAPVHAWGSDVVEESVDTAKNVHALDYVQMVAVLRESGACFKCGKVGHIAKHCWSSTRGKGAPRGRGRGARVGFSNHARSSDTQVQYGAQDHQYAGKRKRDE
jgi:hypothetical protein